MDPEVAPEQIAAVRRFNRFHTRLAGALDEGLLASPYSLAQARLLYEIAQDDGVSAADLAQRLELDPGYLSRLLAHLAGKKLVSRRSAEADGRRLELRLTNKGRAAFAELDSASAREVAALLAPLTADARRRLVGAMERIERLLGDLPSDAPFILREPEAGDMGWIVHRHGVLYRQEYGWDWTFEALVAEIVAAFVKTCDPVRERCWVAEREGEVVGSVFLTRGDDETAKLRLLYVEPLARGVGLGRRLVEECLRFARAHGYRRVTLWTNSVLVSARRIYQTAGFRLVSEQTHHSFGKDLVGQVWECAL